jgi:hypothetical protein
LFVLRLSKLEAGALETSDNIFNKSYNCPINEALLLSGSFSALFYLAFIFLLVASLFASLRFMVIELDSIE